MSRSRKSLLAAPGMCVVGAVAVAASLTLFVVDYVQALDREPRERELRQALELAVREDAAQAAVLTVEYERQRDESLRRQTRADVYTAILAVSAIVFLIGAKRHASLRGRATPTVRQIEIHRSSPGTAKKRRRRRRRSSAVTSSPAAAPPIDLGFVDRVVEEEGTSKEAAIPILQRIQAHYRYLPDEALKRVCELTDISPAQITGVSSFYSRLRRSPVGRHVVKICHGTACHVCGAAHVTEEVRRSLKIPAGADTDPAREFTVDEVACFGCCSLAPVLMVDDETVGRLTPARATDAIADAIEDAVERSGEADR